MLFVCDLSGAFLFHIKCNVVEEKKVQFPGGGTFYLWSVFWRKPFSMKRRDPSTDRPTTDPRPNRHILYPNRGHGHVPRHTEWVSESCFFCSLWVRRRKIAALFTRVRNVHNNSSIYKVVAAAAHGRNKKWERESVEWNKGRPWKAIKA